MTMTTDVVKLKTTKDIITYLAKKFPQCFSVEGNAKPLKIGIFEDLANQLAEDEHVSKTRIRTALRNYTNSWRYLHSVKVGTQRVDLDGNPCGEITQEQQQHAEQQLAESKAAAAARAAERRQQQGADEAKETRRKRSSARTNVPSRKKHPAPPAKQTQEKRDKPATAPLTAVSAQQLQVGQQVKVKAGKVPVSGLVKEVERDEVHVQLQNGLTVKVGIAAVFVAKQE